MRIVVCGATGSVGGQTIDVARRLGIQVAGVSFNAQVKKGQALVKQVKAPYAYCAKDPSAGNVAGFEELLAKAKPHLVVNAVVGYAGLPVSALAVSRKIDLALANKESLVVAGHWLTRVAKKNKTAIYPVDSEHAALHELLKNVSRPAVAQVFLTASGGPFWGWDEKRLAGVSVAQATAHPTWRMGAKISVDSATLANKAYELIEAYHLFGFKDVYALRHAGSVAHAGIALRDGSVRLHASAPDMRLPIALALQRFKSNRFGVSKIPDLTASPLAFEAIDERRWPLLALARECIAKPQTTRGAILAVANDFAVSLFLSGQIAFAQIVPLARAYWADYRHRHLQDLTAAFAAVAAAEADLAQNWRRHLSAAGKEKA